MATVDVRDEGAGPRPTRGGEVRTSNNLLQFLSHLFSRVDKVGETSGSSGASGSQCEDSQRNIPAEEKLFSARSQFVNRVSEPVLDQLLDKLLERGIINDVEMMSLRAKAHKAEKARDVIDTVQRKGTKASSVLIAALWEVDPCLSRELKLR